MALELNGTTGVSLVQDGVVTAADLASGAITSAALPTGSVLQVVSTTLTTDFTASVAQDTVVDITGLADSITPTSTSNKVLVMLQVHSRVGGDHLARFQLERNGIKIGSNTSSSGFESLSTVGFTPRIFDNDCSSISFLDEPSSTSSLTYQVRVSHSFSSTTTIYINRPQSTTTRHGRYVSTITLMEIAG